MNNDFVDIFADERTTPLVSDKPNVKEEFFDVFADERGVVDTPPIQQGKPLGTLTSILDAPQILKSSVGAQPPDLSVQPQSRYVGGAIGGPTELSQLPTQPQVQPEQRPPGIYQGDEQDFVPTGSLSGASRKALQAYLTEASLGAPKLMPGYEEETPYGWEKLPVGIAGAAGFITGAPVGIVKGVTKGITKTFPALSLFGHEGGIARFLKSAAKEVPALSAASTVASAIDAHQADSPEQAWKILKDAAKGGALMGGTFAGARSSFWRESKDRLKRMAYGMLAMRTIRGDPSQWRGIEEEVTHGIIDGFFLFHGLPDVYKGLENEMVEKMKDPEMVKTVKDLEKGKVEKKEDELPILEEGRENPYSKMKLEEVEAAAKLGVDLAKQELKARESEGDIPEDLEKPAKSPLGKIQVSPPGTGFKKGKEKAKKEKEAATEEKVVEEVKPVIIKKEKKLETAAKTKKKAKKKEVEPIKEFLPVEGEKYAYDSAGNIVKKDGTPFKTKLSATLAQKKLISEGKNVEIGESKDGFVLREVGEVDTSGKKITIEEAKPIEEVKVETPTDVRKRVATRVKELRKSEKGIEELDELEGEMEGLAISKEREDFDSDWKYEQFTDVNDSVLDLIRKVKEEKGGKKEEVDKKVEEKDFEGEELVDIEEVSGEGDVTSEVSKLRRKRKEVEDEEDRILDEEGMLEELDFEKGGTKLYSGIPIDAIVDAVVNRVTRGGRKDRDLTRQAILKRERKEVRATDVDLKDIRQMSTAKGFDEKETKRMITSVLGWKRSIKDLTREEADLIKIKLVHMEGREVLENEALIDGLTNVKSSTKKTLKRAVKTYDVDDAELSDYIDSWTGKDRKIDNHVVNRVIATIRAVNEIRPDKGRIIFKYLAPAKRLLGEKVMASIRKGEIGRLEGSTPYDKRVHDAFSGLGLKSEEAVNEYLERTIKKESLSPQELSAAKLLEEIYSELWHTFEIPGWIKHYSPHMKKNMSEQEMINWAFSRKGIEEFEFWAENQRRGEIDSREKSAKKLALAYVRAGFTKKYYSKVIEEIEPMIAKMSPERQKFANQWMDTVIRRRPTADEVVMNRLVKKFMKAAGMKVEENSRVYKQLVGTFLDFNYSAFMGMRPKLAMRNMTQQVLIMNEYGYGNYLKGRIGKFSKEVKDAMDKSDTYKLRKKQYMVLEESVNKISDISADVRQKMMWFYRMADLDNVETAFATGYLMAKKNNPKLKESYAIRAGEKAIHNTQWGYGMDLPYLFKTPTGKLLGQYMSWPIWYADHMQRIVKERDGAKAARTIAQATLIYYLLDEYGIDYTRTVFLGAMPKALGFGAQSIANVALLLNTLGSGDTKKIKNTAKDVSSQLVLGLMPGYLGAKDLKAFMRGDYKSALIYTKKKKSSSRSKGLGRLGRL